MAVSERHLPAIEILLQAAQIIGYERELMTTKLRWKWPRTGLGEIAKLLAEYDQQLKK